MKFNRKKAIISLLILLLLIFIGFLSFKRLNFNSSYKVGQAIDSLNGVKVYYNGGVDHVSERNTTFDNYNLGMKYQCVEFVKRYYYEHLNHKMPDSYGNAKDFFNNELGDSTKNEKRDLIQFSNPSKSKPKVDDLVVFSGNIFNRYGHVAIISAVTDSYIELIQQNPGPFSTSRVTISIENNSSYWKINNDRVLGWLRKEQPIITIDTLQ